VVTVHSPWPLFCSDLELAQRFVLLLWGELEPIPTELVMLGPSVGLHTACAGLLSEGKRRLQPQAQRQLAFRLARANGRANPYPALIPETIHQYDANRLQQLTQDPGSTLQVMLRGGIGDHLELISLLAPWARARNQRVRLLTTATRQRQLARVVAPLPGITLAVANGSGEEIWIQAMNLRSLIYSEGQPVYQAFIQPPPASTSGELVCCWRAAGIGSPHSAWCRSIPFETVVGFYNRLLAAGRTGLSIVDLSHWKPWEAAQLQGLGIQRIDPGQGDVLQLAQRIQGATVLTIDTALAHLCAAMGQQATLLLPRFHDERWMELHRPQHSYGQLLQIRRQEDYGDWSSVLAELPIN